MPQDILAKLTKLPVPHSESCQICRLQICMLSFICSPTMQCRLLQADERNFHGWGYRQFLMKLMQAAPDEEEAYAASKIDRNFSNYSAWHLKTRLLQKLHQQSPTVTLDDLLNKPPSGQRSHQNCLCALSVLFAFVVTTHVPLLKLTCKCSGAASGPSLGTTRGASACNTSFLHRSQ